jgi:hypothetical protein
MNILCKQKALSHVAGVGRAVAGLFRYAVRKPLPLFGKPLPEGSKFLIPSNFITNFTVHFKFQKI